MKCPKCEYLGFDTGDRCRNCGYDFSLIERASDVGPEIFDVPLHDVPLRSAPAPHRADPPLPLFAAAPGEAADEPLIKLVTPPRPPLAVRRTPESPRLRAAARSRRVVEAPELNFVDDAGAASLPAAQDAASRETGSAGEPGSLGARLLAAAIDMAMLLALDVTVIYFTLRMAVLPLDQWLVLPVAPLLAFLCLLKLSYFFAFTAVGGQTIGKMAARIRVVTEAGTPLDGTQAMRRTAAAALSAAAFGLGFVPAILDPHHLALHDRLARTRVVALRSA
jgi:uncharacterized RDD family membrane protein YckC